MLRPVVLAHTGQAIRYDGVEMSLSGARAIQPRSLIAVAIPPAIAPNSHPSGRPRCSYGNSLATSTRASGTTPLAPRPVTIRHSAICPMEVAVAVNAVSLDEIHHA